MANSVVEQIESTPVSGWTRATVADGNWLNKNTIQPLVERDEILASAIDNLAANPGVTEEQINRWEDTHNIVCANSGDWGKGTTYNAGTDLLITDSESGPVISVNTNGKAVGTLAFAEGSITSAIGDCSHAEGHQTSAMGNLSHAEGESTSATDFASHAEGCATLAANQQAHAEGLSTHALGLYTHAEGVATTAVGAFSHAEGNGTSAVGNGSHAEGINTSAVGNYSHAGGYDVCVDGYTSFAHGHSITASGDYIAVFGQLNKISGTNIFVAGDNNLANVKHGVALGFNNNIMNRNAIAIGQNASAVDDAFVVSFLDENQGSAYAAHASIAMYNSSAANGSVAIKGSSAANGSFALGNSYAINSGFAIGLGTRAENGLTAIGRYNETTVGAWNEDGTVNSDYPIFVIGRGASETDKRDALVMNYNGGIIHNQSRGQYLSACTYNQETGKLQYQTVMRSYGFDVSGCNANGSVTAYVNIYPDTITVFNANKGTTSMNLFDLIKKVSEL